MRASLLTLPAAPAMMASPASADAPPGEPPWTRHVVAACDAQGCVEDPPTLTSVGNLAGDRPGTLRLNGRDVAYPATREAAEAAGLSMTRWARAGSTAS